MHRLVSRPDAKSKPSHSASLASHHLGLGRIVHPGAYQHRMQRPAPPIGTRSREGPTASRRRASIGPRSHRRPGSTRRAAHRGGPGRRRAIGLGLLEKSPPGQARAGDSGRRDPSCERSAGLVGQRGHAKRAPRPARRGLPGLLVLVAQLAEIDGGGSPGARPWLAAPRPRRGARPAAGQWPARREPGQQGLLLAVLGAALGHMDVLVPLEERVAHDPEACARGHGGGARGRPRRRSSDQLWYPERPGCWLRTVLTPVRRRAWQGRSSPRASSRRCTRSRAELKACSGEIDRQARADHLVYLRDEVGHDPSLPPRSPPCLTSSPTCGRHARAPRRLKPPGAVPRGSGRAGDPGPAAPRVRSLRHLDAGGERAEHGGRPPARPSTSGRRAGTKSLQFLEPNLGGIGGLHMVPTASRILAEVVLPVLRTGYPQLELESAQDIRALLMQDLLDHLEATGRAGRTVCFVEPKYAATAPTSRVSSRATSTLTSGSTPRRPRTPRRRRDHVQGRVIDLVYQTAVEIPDQTDGVTSGHAAGLRHEPGRPSPSWTRRAAEVLGDRCSPDVQARSAFFAAPALDAPAAPRRHHAADGPRRPRRPRPHARENLCQTQPRVRRHRKCCRPRQCRQWALVSAALAPRACWVAQRLVRSRCASSR
jgi:hypothetical protein